MQKNPTFKVGFFSRRNSMRNFACDLGKGARFVCQNFLRTMDSLTTTGRRLGAVRSAHGALTSTAVICTAATSTSTTSSPSVSARLSNFVKN